MRYVTFLFDRRQKHSGEQTNLSTHLALSGCGSSLWQSGNDCYIALQTLNHLFPVRGAMNTIIFAVLLLSKYQAVTGYELRWAETRV